MSTPQGSGERARAYTHSTSCNASMVLAATDVWIKAWLEGGEGRVSVRVKKNAESRCYVGWKKGGGREGKKDARLAARLGTRSRESGKVMWTDAKLV